MDNPIQKYRIDYSPEIAQVISDLYQEGKSIATISRMPEMPSAGAMYGWAKDHPEFKAKLKAAREVRAMIMEDEILDMAGSAESLDKDAVPGARLKLDILKWGTEVSDPATYGKKTVISGDSKQPVVFHINTGVPAPTEEAVQLAADGLMKEVVAEQHD